MTEVNEQKTECQVPEWMHKCPMFTDIALGHRKSAFEQFVDSYPTAEQQRETIAMDYLRGIFHRMREANETRMLTCTIRAKDADVKDRVYKTLVDKGFICEEWQKIDDGTFTFTVSW